MPNSKRFNQLKKRLINIETLYLPRTKQSGNYSKKEEDDLRAYLLLVHAEIESYFEEICEEKAKDAFKKWKATRAKSNVLLSLASYCDAIFDDNEIEKRINKTLSNYINKLKKNHGIKEKNILSMLLPISLEYPEIDTTWLNTMSAFGTSRGEIAHTAARVQNALDPVTLKSTVLYLINEIQILDEKLISIR